MFRRTRPRSAVWAGAASRPGRRGRPRGPGLAALGTGGWRVLPVARAARRPEAAGMQSALHAATATLPHLRSGLTARTAQAAVPHLRTLTGAAAIALADARTVLAIEGE